MAKNAVLNQIQKNIDESGFHLYLVTGGPSPRFLYTIGLIEKIGFELVLAGSAYFEDEDASNIISRCSEACLASPDVSELKFKIGKTMHCFSFAEIDASWHDTMLLGAVDFYKSKKIRAKQIFPEPKYATIDIPRMSIPLSPHSNPMWRWLEAEWSYSIPDDSTVLTNVDALQGRQLTEIARWEDNTWAIFSGVGRSQSKIREVSMGIFLALDPSLEFVIDMEVDDGFWKEPNESKWKKWENSEK